MYFFCCRSLTTSGHPFTQSTPRPLSLLPLCHHLSLPLLNAALILCHPLLTAPFMSNLGTLSGWLSGIWCCPLPPFYLESSVFKLPKLSLSFPFFLHDALHDHPWHTRSTATCGRLAVCKCNVYFDVYFSNNSTWTGTPPRTGAAEENAKLGWTMDMPEWGICIRFVCYDNMTPCELCGLWNVGHLTCYLTEIYELHDLLLARHSRYKSVPAHWQTSYTPGKERDGFLSPGHEYVLRTVVKVGWMAGRTGGHKSIGGPKATMRKTFHHSPIFLFAPHLYHRPVATCRANSMLQRIRRLALPHILGRGSFFSREDDWTHA